MLFQQACLEESLHKKDPGFLFKIGKGPYKPFQNCAMGRKSSDYPIEYALQFWRTYKKQRKYFKLRFLDSHEYTGEKSTFLDGDLKTFFDTMDKEGHLDNTVVMFYSDHGDHIAYYGHLTSSGQQEKMNPFFYTLLPESLNKVYGESIRANQNALVTHADIYASDFKFAHPESAKPRFNGKSLFHSVIPHGRNCQTESIGELCQCMRGA